ncbi:LysM peptidoglycan-binding domain-containing protein [Methylobacterium sp. PvR107]|uniref:LysM peptidoglycan-binding domain-containing protein n=1 Tax=Methylobacterium sp. PvR107 TaxID=2806597 RepID=UPI001AE6C8BF|nr:LysM peptidoglycan-binding domain-containing protein [Methylobacterium sp. PvR107]
MSGQVRRSLALALAGLFGGLGLVAALFGGESLRRLTGRDAAEPPAAAAPVPQGSLRGLADPGTIAKAPDPAIDFRNDPPKAARPGAARPDPAMPGAPDARSARPVGEPGAAEAPRFDIVRVEPNGDAVVAGRGAPHAEVEMLVDGKPVAKATADASGQFAIVPPALPAGSSTIRLRMTAKDGQPASSQQSVAVNVAPGRDRQPLVALTAPDAATVVLSQPGAAGPAASARIANAAPGQPLAPNKQAAGDGRTAAHPGPAQPTRIVSVDVQGNGRLFVTASGTPGATLRLYLNDTLIAPGSIGPDGRASFTIGRGVKPGQYHVRIDQIDPATGKVASRAEVPLAVPEPAPVAAREPAAPSGGQGVTRESSRTVSRETAQSPEAAAPRQAASPATAPVTRMAPAPDARPDTRQLAAKTGTPAPAGAVFVPEISTARITRGDNLWRISQRTYGRGERYTVIYDANQNQIRDPDLIYPGQIFVLPPDKRG